MIMPLTVKEVLRQAEAEGLTLVRSDSSCRPGQPGSSRTGFRGVKLNSDCPVNPYQARVRRGGKQVSLGLFATAEEAALCYARSREEDVAAAALAPPPLTAEEALRQAEAEGLTLLPSEGCSGYKGVYLDSSSKSKPYMARVRRGDKNVNLGSYKTMEEAALHVARASAAQAAAPQPPAASSRKRKVRSEEQPPDVPADVVVILEGRFVESTTF